MKSTGVRKMGAWIAGAGMAVTVVAAAACLLNIAILTIFWILVEAMVFLFVLCATEDLIITGTTSTLKILWRGDLKVRQQTLVILP